MVENVIIEFTPDFTELDRAFDQLTKSGKVDKDLAAQFTNTSKAINTTAKDTNILIQQFKKVATTATQLGKSVEAAFEAGVQDALDEAGVSAEEFAESLRKANQPAKSLRQEMKDLREALALAKAAGKDTGAEFDSMRARAGLLADAIDDANKEIKNAGSDTRHLDNVVGSISALAGGFAAVQGAAAIFGDESEDLQKTLVKVNGAMALATGLQQFYNATLKEGSLTKLADTVITKGQSLAQSVYATAIGTSTGALKAFRIALLATGIGAIIAVITLAVQAMSSFGDTTKKTAEELERFSGAVDASRDSLDRFISSQNNANDLAIEKAKQRGATEAEINKMVVDGLRQNAAETDRLVKGNLGELNRLAQEVNESIKDQGASVNIAANAYEQFNGKGTTAFNILDRIKKLKISGEFDNLSKSAKEAVNNLEEAANKVNDIREQSGSFSAQADLRDAQFRTRQIEEQRAKEKAAREKAAAEAKAERARQLQDELAALERKLLAVEKNTQAEIDIRKQIVAQKAKIDLNAEKLKENQILLIKERSLNDQLQLQDEFNKKLTNAQLQAQVDTTNALLAGIGISNDTRLQLQIENINALSQLEINAAEGNASKIYLIEQKKIADIRALRLAAIDQERAAQVSASQKTNDVVKTALAKLAQDRKQDIDARFAAIQGIERQELTSNQNLIDDNKRKYDEGLISLSDYQAKQKELLDQAADIERQSIDAQAAARQSDKEQRIADLEEIAQKSIEIAGEVATFFSNLSALATEQDRQRIDLQKKQLESLVEAGAISEKEAKVRAQQIEILERQAKNRQAQREKQIAVFNAIIAIPQAVLKGLTTGGPILAAIYGALAAAQAALVISRPVPKFFRGKKDKYEGPGVVADMGSEIVERNGRMFLYTEPTKTYLGAKDKVYTASETRAIMHNTSLRPAVKEAKPLQIDYDRLAKSFPKTEGVKIDVNKDYIEESFTNALNKTRYFNSRYKF